MVAAGRRAKPLAPTAASTLTGGFSGDVRIICRDTAGIVRRVTRWKLSENLKLSQRARARAVVTALRYYHCYLLSLSLSFSANVITLHNVIPPCSLSKEERGKTKGEIGRGDTRMKIFLSRAEITVVRRRHGANRDNIRPSEKVNSARPSADRSFRKDRFAKRARRGRARVRKLGLSVRVYPLSESPPVCNGKGRAGLRRHTKPSCPALLRKRNDFRRGYYTRDPSRRLSYTARILFIDLPFL